MVDLLFATYTTGLVLLLAPEKHGALGGRDEYYSIGVFRNTCRDKQTWQLALSNYGARIVPSPTPIVRSRLSAAQLFLNPVQVTHREPWCTSLPFGPFTKNASAAPLQVRGLRGMVAFTFHRGAFLQEKCPTNWRLPAHLQRAKLALSCIIAKVRQTEASQRN